MSARGPVALVAVLALLGAVAGLGLALWPGGAWRARAVVELRSGEGPAEPRAARPAELDAAAEAVRLDAFARAVAAAVPGTGDLTGRLDAGRAGSDLLAVRARADEPAVAAALAGVAAQQVLARRAVERREALLARVEALRRALPVAAASDRPRLADELRTLRARASGGGDVGQVVAVPGAGDARRVRTPLPWTLGGLLAGGALGLAVVALRRRFGRRAGGASDVADRLGLAPAALLPSRTSGASGARRDEEAFRALRVMVQRTGGTVVVVSSAGPGEGKTDVAAGLARALARAGRSVAVVEADLRRPALAARLDRAPGPEDAGGLTTAIVGGVPAPELLVDAGDGVRLLRRGAAVPNGPEILAADDVSRVLAELRATVDVVVLDTAPLLPVADTSALLGRPEVDLLLLVARAGHVRRDELRRLRAGLPGLAPATVRLVVNDERGTSRRYDAYLAAVDEDALG